MASPFWLGAANGFSRPVCALNRSSKEALGFSRNGASSLNSPVESGLRSGSRSQFPMSALCPPYVRPMSGRYAGPIYARQWEPERPLPGSEKSMNSLTNDDSQL